MDDQGHRVKRPWPVNPALYRLDAPDPCDDHGTYARAVAVVVLGGVMGIAGVVAICIGIGAALS